MKIVLTPAEARVVGSLLEKQITTPDQYPMSLNGVVAACNQKSNRDPVMSLSENAVQDTLDLLVKKHQLSMLSGAGNRVVKYEQRFCNSAFGTLKLNSAEVAIVATLLLRGAQTPGELRTRSARLHDFVDVADVEQTLEQLSRREDGPFVARLAREPGKRESRYMHLFSGDVTAVDENDIPGADRDIDALGPRVSQLEQQVAELKQQLAALLADKGV
nr:DUF480 domain-containing protein [Pantoea sp. 201603H]